MRTSIYLMSVIAAPLVFTTTGACSGASPEPTSTELTGSASSALQGNGDDNGEGDGDGDGLRTHRDDHGRFANYSTAGRIDHDNEFFQSLGTNGRACSTCHRESDGFSLSTKTVKRVFDDTQGTDPLFRTVDGANAPNADVSTLHARRDAYSLLLNRGVIRIELAIPANAQFSVVSVQDPYGYATAENLSLYRRPLMSSNLKFVVGTSIMWDGREPSLASQANDATLGHAQAASPLSPSQQQHIVDFETSLFTAQTHADEVGDLVPAGGGPVALSAEPFAPGENTLALLPHLPTTDIVFGLYSAWSSSADAGKESALRGQTIFNTRPITKGPFGNFACSTCHSALNAGSNDFAPGQFAVLGVSGEGISPPGPPASITDQFLAADLPVYTLENNVTHATFRTSDPGRALVTGKWADVGRFQVPVLRGVASHAPYFHNGLALTLLDVVNFYDTTLAIPFGMPFTDQEKADLVAFLSTL